MKALILGLLVAFTAGSAQAQTEGKPTSEDMRAFNSWKACLDEMIPAYATMDEPADVLVRAVQAECRLDEVVYAGTGNNPEREKGAREFAQDYVLTHMLKARAKNRH